MLPHVIEALSSSDRGFVVNICTFGPLAFVYGHAAANTWPVGRHLGLLNGRINEQRIKLKLTGFTTRTLCVGHSLGAHVCGFMGKETHVDRIIGMDPAGKFIIL